MRNQKWWADLTLVYDVYEQNLEQGSEITLEDELTALQEELNQIKKEIEYDVEEDLEELNWKDLDLITSLLENIQILSN